MATENKELQTQAGEEETKKQLVTLEKNVADNVLNRISQLQNTGEIYLPDNYSPQNALKSAWLVLLETTNKDGAAALAICTKESIANALYEMVVRGLSVIKKQCYFVMYGNQLVLEESYIGKIAQAKRDADVKEVNAVTVYEKDVFEFMIDLENGGRKIVTKHEQKLENIDIEKIKGAYAIITYNDGSSDTEIMTFAQIKKSWEQGGAKGKSGAHINFADQMCEKTVIGRALKIPVNSADDSNVIGTREDRTSANVNYDINKNANREEIGVEDDHIQHAEVVVEEESGSNGQQENNNQPAKPDF